MNLAFKFNEISNAVIYSSDDPDYRVGVGRVVENETFPLTPGEEQARILFLVEIEKIKNKNIKSNVDDVIEGIKDFIMEWRIQKDEYSLR